jgi:SEC-C motif-containing protein
MEMPVNCPCGSEKTYKECCEPIIKGKKKAETAEALMRSRYTAYVVGEVEYLGRTLDSRGREEFDIESTREWSKDTDWKELEIVSVEQGGLDDENGIVEFIARYEMDEQLLEHHERASFKKSDAGEWEFVDGRVIGRDPYRRETPKIGRNDPCPCDSGKKYKKCCGKA